MARPLRVLFTGTSGAGKSTVLERLASSQVDYYCIPEVPRALLKQDQSLEKDRRFPEILLAKQLEQEEQGVLSGKTVVITDRGLIDIAVFASFYGHELPTECVNLENRYDLVFLFSPWECEPLPSPDDGYELRRIQLHFSFIDYLTINNIPYQEVQGNVGERCGIVCDFISKHL